MNASLFSRLLLAAGLSVATGLTLGCGGASAGGSTTTAGRGVTYSINLHRPYTAGQRFRLTNDATREETIHGTLGEQLVDHQQHSTTIRITAIVEVLGVTPDRSPAALRYTVESASLSVDGAQGAFLEPGAVIEVQTAATADAAVVSVNGQPAPAELLRELRTVLTLNHGSASEDELFGTTTPRAVGETWQPDFSTIASDLARRTFLVDPARMTGAMRLVEHRADQSLLIEGRVDATGAQLTGGAPGTTTTEGSLSIVTSRVLPIDVAQLALAESQTIELMLTMNVPTGAGTVLMQMHMTTHGSLTREPL